MKRKVTLIMTFVLCCLLILTGCSSNGQTATSQAGTPDKAAEPEFKWRFQVIHNPEQIDYKLFEEACDEVYTATNGRMEIELFPSGSFASSLEAFQACGEGVFEMHSSWPLYIIGIDYAFEPMTSGNMSMSALDRMIYMEEGGGTELLQEGLDELNLELLSYRVGTADVMLAISDFKSIAEMKNKKFRNVSPAIAVAQDIAAITLPIEDVFTTMASGGVDMVEANYLTYMKDLGITEVAPYGIYPDFWNVSPLETVVINQNAWNKLPKDLQVILKAVFDSKTVSTLAAVEMTSARDLKELSDSGEVQFRRLDPQQFADMRKDMIEIEADYMKKNGPDSLTTKTYNTIYQFYEDYYPYREVASHWGTGLTAGEIAGFEIPKYHLTADE